MKTRCSRRRPLFILSVLAVAGASIFQAACDDDSAVKENPDPGTPRLDAGTPVTDSATGTDATLTDADCFLNPTTHVEIINACTDATRITKNPTLPKLYPDGGLPPIP